MAAKKKIHGAHDGLIPLLVPIDSVHHDPRNARLHDERNVESIRASYAAHGQRKPLIGKLPERIITAGNGQLDAARLLGWTHVAVLFVDEDENAARQFALRDNRTGELAQWDLQALGAELRAMTEAGADLMQLGWTGYEAEPLLVADWKPGDTDPGYQPPGSGDGSHQVRFSKEQWEAIRSKVETYCEANDASQATALVALVLKALA